MLPRPLPPPIPLAEFADLATWLDATAPPTTPIVLQRNRYGLALITVTEPQWFWRHAREELAAGPRGQAGIGLLGWIRRVKSAVESEVTP